MDPSSITSSGTFIWSYVNTRASAGDLYVLRPT